MRTEWTEKSIRFVVLTKEYVTCGQRSRRMKRRFASLQLQFCCPERTASGHLSLANQGVSSGLCQHGWLLLSRFQRINVAADEPCERRRHVGERH